MPIPKAMVNYSLSADFSHPTLIIMMSLSKWARQNLCRRNYYIVHEMRTQVKRYNLPMSLSCLLPKFWSNFSTFFFKLVTFVAVTSTEMALEFLLSCASFNKSNSSSTSWQKRKENKIHIYSSYEWIVMKRVKLLLSNLSHQFKHQNVSLLCFCGLSLGKEIEKLTTDNSTKEDDTISSKQDWS